MGMSEYTTCICSTNEMNCIPIHIWKGRVLMKSGWGLFMDWGGANCKLLIRSVDQKVLLFTEQPQIELQISVLDHDSERTVYRKSFL